MDCEQALEAISAALDGELTAAEQAELEAHLSVCPECRALAEDFAMLNAVLAETESAPPQSLVGEVTQRIAGQDKVVPISSGRRHGWRRWAGLAAMLALVVCAGGLGLWLHGGVQWGWKDLVQSYSNEASGGANNAPSGDAPQEFEPSADTGWEDGLEPSVSEPTQERACASPEASSDLNGGDYPEPCAPPEDLTPAATASAKVSSSLSPAAPAAAAITEEQALELVFVYLGGYESYPEARLRYTTVYGGVTPAYYLKTEPAGEGTTSEYYLDYVRLSEDEEYHEIRLYETVTDKEHEAGRTATFNWYSVDAGGSGEILEELPAEDETEDTVEYENRYMDTAAGE